MYQLFMVAAVAALFLPFFGPMLDHHFAERQYDHAHVYLGPPDTQHIHFYEAPHLHSHVHQASASPPASDLTSNDWSDQVVYLTSHDGIGPGFASLVTTSLYIDFVFPEPGNSHFRLGPDGQDNLPLGILTPPPRKPPRV